MRAQILIERVKILLEILPGNLPEGRFYFLFRDNNFIGFGFLNLQRFIDPVMMSPLTIAVARRTLGSFFPKIVNSSGISSPV